jgi:hypothetical protein
MAKNVRIVPASGSIYFTADGYDITGSVVLRTLGDTEDLEFSNGGDQSVLLISKDSGRVGIGTVSASAKLEVSSSTDQDALQVNTPNGNIKVTGDGVLQLSEYQGTTGAINGGLIFSSSQLFVGL